MVFGKMASMFYQVNEKYIFYMTIVIESLCVRVCEQWVMWDGKKENYHKI